MPQAKSATASNLSLEYRFFPIHIILVLSVFTFNPDIEQYISIVFIAAIAVFISSDVIDRQDHTEDMTYRETVRSVHSFMAWNHIPVYECDLSEPDKSNHLWKGKNPKKPARISVAMSPNDWLCQKLERLKHHGGRGVSFQGTGFCGSKKRPFYCVNTSYPMDNCFTGRHDRSRQSPEKDVLYIIPAGPVRRVHSPGGASYFLFLSRQRDVIASFSFGAWRVKTCFQRQGNFGFIPNSSVLFHI